ncbi:pentatricopeptide repeat-containing protein At1g59720, chloroplastic/mitochondrial-like [Juglans regia]|uniref:Pentatricopeptide repeat-containing protein At1g59720, chloroplastic/mitochondrial-like n=1 Tax=Juglans regia TaxID=51240 RepID=A0A2I4F4L6_JUGRE|nr:pentatricopeptide repeat-containing protein At1g59720, chloroplastic/mitochondrial-like [Juglans regia]
MTVNCLKSNSLSFRLRAKEMASLLFPLSFSKLNLSSLSTNSATACRKEQSLMSLFKQCSTLKDLKQVHAHVIQTGFNQYLYVIGKIIVFCAVSEHGEMDYAVSVFNGIENPDGFLWNTMIRGLGKTNQPERAFEFYKRMQKRGEVADNFTFSFLLKFCGQLGSVMLGKQIHCDTMKQGLESHVFVRNTLIHMYGMLKDSETARRLFEEISMPDVVAWNTVIDCHVYCGKFKEALDLFLRMLQCGIDPDEATLVVTLSGCSGLGALDFGRWVHSCIKGSDLSKIVSVSNSLIDMYAKCGAVEEAYEIFNNMKIKDIVSWNTMIIGLAAHGHADEALAVFSKMLEEKIETPDEVTFMGVLSACSHGGMIDYARRYFDVMSKDYRIQPSIKHYGCMVDALGRAGFVEEAYELIRSMPIECNAIVWRTLLAACGVHGYVVLGEKVRNHLLELEPGHSSDYVLLANMYASLGQWSEMTGVRKAMQDRGVQKTEPGNSFIGLHGRTRLEMKTEDGYKDKNTTCTQWLQ